MTTFSVDSESDRPLFEQLVDHFRSEIEGGGLGKGDRFPSDYELMAAHHVARVTVRRAVAELVREGMLVRIQGKGTYVVGPKLERQIVDVASFTARMASLGLRAESKLLGKTVIKASHQDKKALHVPIGTEVLCITRVRLTKGEPVALEASRLSLARFPALESLNLQERSLYRTLEDHYGVRPTSAQKTLELVRATVPQARQLDCHVGAPLFLIRSTVMTGSEVLEAVKTLLRGDRFRFRIS